MLPQNYLYKGERGMNKCQKRVNFLLFILSGILLGYFGLIMAYFLFLSIIMTDYSIRISLLSLSFLSFCNR